ncbi:MAG: L,D-transpeptidase family protein [Marinifilaceae bacterium]|jgi:murein L,D-transpeptidase YafK|nr:L,D-transpeptidase family protein [Marinifilaceae bacterium]
MFKILNILFVLFTILSSKSDSFKSNQLRYSRVRKAYNNNYSQIKKLFESKNINLKTTKIYLRVFKHDKEIELWAKNKSDKSYKYIKSFDICRNSGDIGPKRKQGDMQTPEGFYHINRFNPYSNFHLSLGINYPNKSDLILADKNDPGDNIFIHGSCVTVGCLPITDKKIEELYIICTEAREAGQKNIPVTIFPSKLSNSKYKNILQEYSNNNDYINLWKALKKAYDIFNNTKKLPTVSFLGNGNHIVKP